MAKRYRYEGQWLTVPEISVLTGLSRETIYRRRCGNRVMTPAEASAMEMPTGPEPRRYRHNGKNLTAREWAARTGITVATIRKRLRNGLPVGEALAPRPAPPTPITFEKTSDWPRLIRELMAEHRISQRRLCTIATINRTTLRTMLAGGAASIDHIERILAVFGYELDAIQRPDPEAL